MSLMEVIKQFYPGFNPSHVPTFSAAAANKFISDTPLVWPDLISIRHFMTQSYTILEHWVSTRASSTNLRHLITQAYLTLGHWISNHAPTNLGHWIFINAFSSWLKQNPKTTTFLIAFTVIFVSIRSLGFDRLGVRASTPASAFQSQRYGGSTPRGGIFATLTSTGMVGTLIPVSVLVASLGAWLVTSRVESLVLDPLN
ncbi:MAG: hypothetical protein M1834_008012 [Cirrosporium novae-zelandiae]|nr:MAG: hypothetical protein M1834_008012 [Cirrosporium novae-zelandiae]